MKRSLKELKQAVVLISTGRLFQSVGAMTEMHNLYNAERQPVISEDIRVSML